MHAKQSMEEDITTPQRWSQDLVNELQAQVGFESKVDWTNQLYYGFRVNVVAILLCQETSRKRISDGVEGCEEDDMCCE